MTANKYQVRKFKDVSNVAIEMIFSLNSSFDNVRPLFFAL